MHCKFKCEIACSVHSCGRSYDALVTLSGLYAGGSATIDEVHAVGHGGGYWAPLGWWLYRRDPYCPECGAKLHASLLRDNPKVPGDLIEAACFQVTPEMIGKRRVTR